MNAHQILQKVLTDFPGILNGYEDVPGADLVDALNEHHDDLKIIASSPLSLETRITNDQVDTPYTALAEINPDPHYHEISISIKRDGQEYPAADILVGVDHVDKKLRVLVSAQGNPEEHKVAIYPDLPKGQPFIEHL